MHDLETFTLEKKASVIVLSAKGSTPLFRHSKLCCNFYPYSVHTWTAEELCSYSGATSSRFWFHLLCNYKIHILIGTVVYPQDTSWSSYYRQHRNWLSRKILVCCSDKLSRMQVFVKSRIPQLLSLINEYIWNPKFTVNLEFNVTYFLSLNLVKFTERRESGQ